MANEQVRRVSIAGGTIHLEICGEAGNDVLTTALKTIRFQGFCSKLLVIKSGLVMTRMTVNVFTALAASAASVVKEASEGPAAELGNKGLPWR